MTTSDIIKPMGLVERLAAGESVIVAEGYLFEFERRGYLKAGHYVPEVVLQHPDLVRQLHEEFVHAGSDVVLAFTYYAHREKLRFIDREDDLEKINRTALRIARQVANETGTLMAGNLCNTNLPMTPGDENTRQKIRDIMKEQVLWAVEEGADYIVLETIGHLEEALIGLKVIQEFGKGLPAVVTMSIHISENSFDDVPIEDALSQVEKAGAAVVGLNCARGPSTMLPVMKKIRQTCKGPLAALPVTFRVSNEEPTMQTLTDENGKRPYPALEAHLNSREQIAQFAKDCKEIGIQYVGLCCGNMACYIRTIAETLGRTPPASKYSPNMDENSYTREAIYNSKLHARVFKTKHVVNT
ncbi:PREDICTED: betaine--homocysteine S-methyltransferase 1-like [Priapulus caudatus]|uniref:Betaine--homocysteine S-methyltransferase 1-like n=1 Tax=Priapulus caudatus TaxID=37621 RepID=A0ABM1F307_PRICU|nr:PREDICTED: betaine--homocysteine S-methyltransferase 1-like [Priapulus caudatus]